MILKRLLYSILLSLIFCCGQPNSTLVDREEIETSNKSKIRETSGDSMVELTEPRNASQYLESDKKKTVLLVPCYNGYEYTQLGYNFDPLLEQKLKENELIAFLPFPYKKMNGFGYQSVYSKKYCDEILNKTDADYLIMTKFIGNQLEIPINRNDKEVWGYETKVLNTKTMKEVVSINTNNQSSYSELEKHLENNILDLVNDILRD